MTDSRTLRTFDDDSSRTIDDESTDPRMVIARTLARRDGWAEIRPTHWATAGALVRKLRAAHRRPDRRTPVTTDPPTFDQWTIVELFGHQRFAGRLRQADWPPDFGHLDIPATPGHEAVTQLINTKAIYRLTPTTEDIATAVAAQCRPAPVHRWELPAGPAGTDDDDPDLSLETRAAAGWPDPEDVY